MRESEAVTEGSPPDAQALCAFASSRVGFDELAVVLDAFGFGLWERDVPGDLMRWSANVHRFLQSGSVTPTVKMFESRVLAADRDVFAQMFAPGTRPNVFRVQLDGGGSRWIQNTSRPLTTRDGTVRGWRGILKVIDREIAAEQRLELMATLASRTRNAVVVTDREGRIEWVNAGFTALTGYALEEALGHRPGDLLQGSDTRLEAKQLMAKALARGESFAVTVLNYRKCGRQYWVHIECDPYFDPKGAVSGFVAVQTDVTERKTASSREALVQRATSKMLTSESIESAAQVVVNELVQELDIRAAQLWMVHEDSPELFYSVGACADQTGEPWLKMSRSLPFRAGLESIRGVGAPGLAWGSGETCAVTDFWGAGAEGASSRRMDAARQAGIRTMCATPVKAGDVTLAVLEVGGSDRYPGHEHLPATLHHMGCLLASFMLAQSARKAFETIFEQSPDPSLLLDHEGRIRSANARAKGLFDLEEMTHVDQLVPGFNEAIETIADGEPMGHSSIPRLVEREAVAATGRIFPAELSVARFGGSRRGVIVSVRDLTERLEIQSALQQSLREKVTLVQEVHHRVKNNLQIISSLVSLQADAIGLPDVKEALFDTGRRVQSMALVHQLLYANEDLSRVDFSAYAKSLCQSLQVSVGMLAVIEVESEPIELPIEQAVPCGLVMNELVTNSLKHGGGADGNPEICVRVGAVDGGFYFQVSDRGPGMKSFPEGRSSFGKTLIEAVARQLRATVEVSSDSGTCVRVTVPGLALLGR